jgi:glucose uptake protein GlcU
MDKSTKVLIAIAIILWTIGTILFFKKGKANTEIVVSAVVIIIAIVSKTRKKKTSS